jgi:broad specificity phosphatase PhoE
MQLILVRHGETSWNVEEVFRGRARIDLDEAGLRQAELVAGYLRQMHIEAVYSSPLERAVHTAEAIAVKHRLLVHSSEALNDLDFGDWEGKSIAVVREAFPEQYMLWISHPERARLPGGETLGDATRRAMTAVHQAIADHQGNVVMVSHRVVIKTLTLALMGLDESKFWNVRVDPCSITAFEHSEGRFILLKQNDTCFLHSTGESLRDF